MGRYCHVCGQENVEPHESFWQLTTHLIYDIVHFDSKFFVTLKTLLFRPGVLTHEYIRGRRVSFLHPVRMYIFTSTIFFLLFFLFVIKPSDFGYRDKAFTLNTEKLQKQEALLRDSAARITDSALKVQLMDKANNLNEANKYLGKIKADSSNNNYEKTEANSNIFNNLPATIALYDSTQNAIPASKKDGWIKKNLIHKAFQVKQFYDADPKNFFQTVTDNFLHSLPVMMFISLPLVALIFQLLYLRRKEFFYVHHGVFVIHTYIAIFIMLLFAYGISALNDSLQWQLLNWLYGIQVVLIFFYTYKAMRNFYGQSRFKTILKYVLILILFSMIMALLLIIFLFKTLFTLHA